MSILINTERFLLREINVTDVTEKYLDWFNDADTKKNISSSIMMKNLIALRKYVEIKTNDKSILFLGIFDKEKKTHIGNIKYEPVDSIARYAVLGLLIGEVNYRGKSVAQEVIRESAKWLKSNRDIKKILLGVSTDNHNAIRSYEKAGFIIEKRSSINIDTEFTVSMVLFI